MAKKDKKKNTDIVDDIDELNTEAGVEVKEKKSNPLFNAVIIILIIVLWLGLFALLIKLDVGGFGSSVMRPIFKDVPIINKILPDGGDDDKSEEYPYKTLGEAINYIKDLEKQIKTLNDQSAQKDEEIAELKAEVNRLKTFEESQLEFEKQKEEYYNEVVFGDSAIDYENYKKYYEEINPDYAEELYKQVLEKYFYDERYKDLADAYSAMKPAKAAAALYEMTGNLETVVEILLNMDVKNRAAVLDALSDVDPVFCGKITVLLSPEKE